MGIRKYLFQLLGSRTIVACAILIQFIAVTGFTDDKDEHTVKALFVYNFTKYIEWHEQSISPQFRIGVLGESAMGEKLSMILKGKKLYNRAIEVKEIKNIDDVAGYQIIYISKSQSDQLKQVIEHCTLSETLIVTEDKNMAAKGSCINIVERDQKIKFEMNETAIKKAGLKVASQLYELAIVVQ